MTSDMMSSIAKAKNEESVAVEALFLGPKSENQAFFRRVCA